MDYTVLAEATSVGTTTSWLATAADPTAATGYGILVAFCYNSTEVVVASEVTLGSVSALAATKCGHTNYGGGTTWASFYWFSKAQVDSANDLQVTVAHSPGFLGFLTVWGIQAEGDLSLASDNGDSTYGKGSSAVTSTPSVTLTTDVQSGDLMLDVLFAKNYASPTDDSSSLIMTQLTSGVYNNNASKESVTGSSATASWSRSGGDACSLYAVALRAVSSTPDPVFDEPNPTLDGAAVTIGDGTVQVRSLTFPSGVYTTPFWVVPDSDTARAQKIDTLPAQLVLKCGTIAISSTAP